MGYICMNNMTTIISSHKKKVKILIMKQMVKHAIVGIKAIAH